MRYADLIFAIRLFDNIQENNAESLKPLFHIYFNYSQLTFNDRAETGLLTPQKLVV
jgi:hypothetical protein